MWQGSFEEAADIAACRPLAIETSTQPKRDCAYASPWECKDETTTTITAMLFLPPDFFVGGFTPGSIAWPQRTTKTKPHPLPTTPEPPPGGVVR